MGPSSKKALHAHCSSNRTAMRAGMKSQRFTDTSNLFNLSLAENAFRFEEKDGDEDQERDGIAVG